VGEAKGKGLRVLGRPLVQEKKNRKIMERKRNEKGTK